MGLIGLVILILLIVWLLRALVPTDPLGPPLTYSSYVPTGGVGVLILVLIILILTGYVPLWGWNFGPPSPPHSGPMVP